jgi:hypothetical protein
MLSLRLHPWWYTIIYHDNSPYGFFIAFASGTCDNQTGRSVCHAIAGKNATCVYGTGSPATRIQQEGMMPLPRYTKLFAGICVSTLLYSVIFIQFSKPLSNHFTEAVIAGMPDAHVFIWNIHTFTERVSAHANPFFTDNVCHPFGVWLVMHTYAPLTGVCNLLIRNPALTLNLFTAGNFVLSALGALLLCYSFYPGIATAFIAGFVFAFCPFKMTHLLAGHYNLIMTAPIPFFILFFRKLYQPSDTPNGKPIVHAGYLPVCGVLLLLQLVCDYYLTYYLLIFSTGYVLYYRFDFGNRRRRTIVALLVAALAAGGIGVVILAAIGIRQQGLYTSADLVSYFIPSAFSRLFGSPFVTFLRSKVFKAGPYENITEIGLSLIILSIAAAIVILRRPKIQWKKEVLFLLLLFFSFATPVINICGHIAGVLPTALIHYIPFINNFRVASRFTIMIMLLLPILSMSVLFESFALSRKHGRYFGILLVLFVTLYLQYLPKPFPLLFINSVPEVYRRLAASPSGTILELPSGIESGGGMKLGTVTTLQMVYQLTHKHKVLGGYLSRLPASFPDRYADYPFIRKMFELLHTCRRDDTPRLPPEEIIRFLVDFNIRHVVMAPGYERSAAGEFVLKNLRGYLDKPERIDGYTWFQIGHVPEYKGNRTRKKAPFTRHSIGKRHRRTGIAHLFRKNRNRLRKSPMQELVKAKNLLAEVQYTGADRTSSGSYFTALSLIDSALARIKTEHEKIPFVRDFYEAKTLLDSSIALSQQIIKTFSGGTVPAAIPPADITPDVSADGQTSAAADR